jgi:hypothetical protein
MARAFPAPVKHHERPGTHIGDAAKPRSAIRPKRTETRSAQRQRPPRRRRGEKPRSHAVLPPHGDEGEDRGKPTITHLLIDAPQFTVCEERTGFRFETEHVCSTFRGAKHCAQDP